MILLRPLLLLLIAQGVFASNSSSSPGSDSDSVSSSDSSSSDRVVLTPKFAICNKTDYAVQVTLRMDSGPRVINLSPKTSSDLVDATTMKFIPITWTINNQTFSFTANAPMLERKNFFNIENDRGDASIRFTGGKVDKISVAAERPFFIENISTRPKKVAIHIGVNLLTVVELAPGQKSEVFNANDAVILRIEKKRSSVRFARGFLPQKSEDNHIQIKSSDFIQYHFSDQKPDNHGIVFGQ